MILRDRDRDHDSMTVTLTVTVTVTVTVRADAATARTASLRHEAQRFELRSDPTQINSP